MAAGRRQSRWGLQAHLVDDECTPVAALSHVTRVAEALHQLRPRSSHVLGTPCTACGTSATRPPRITYIPGTASPAWNRKAPAGNRVTSPKRRTRSISAAERTGNIWWNRDAGAALEVADAPGASCALRSFWLGMSNPRN